MPLITNPVLQIEHLHVAWENDLILHGLSASIGRGEAVAVTGANGSGKSTLLKAIIGVAPITLGAVHIFGVDTADHKKVNWPRVGYVPQRISSGGGVSASVLEVVTSGLLGAGRLCARPGDKKRALAALKQVGMAHRAKESMSILSGGQQQRVLIARALVRDPELLLMDEPMAGIDAHSRQRLADICAQAKACGTTLVVVLHELGELRPILTRQLHISAGHIHYDGVPRIDQPDPSQVDHL